MIDFIEVNANNSDKCLVNLNKVHKIVPVIGGTGCIFHFDNGKTQGVTDSYLEITAKLTNPDVITEPKVKPEVVVEKKEAAKAKS